MSLRRFACSVVLLTAAGLFVPLAVVAQESFVRQTRTVAAFTEIEFAVPGTAYIRQGESRSVEVEASENDLERLETVVEGDALAIRGEDDGFGWFGWLGGGTGFDGTISAYITVPSIRKIAVAGSGRVVSEMALSGTSFDLENAGSGGFDLEIRADEIEVESAGSGESLLRGQAETLSVHVAGAGDVDAAQLDVATASAHIAGSGDVRVRVSDHLSIEIVGSGDVWYLGDPEVETNVLGTGDARPIE